MDTKLSEMRLENKLQKMSFDCCFLDDRTGGINLPVLVGCDRASRSVIAHAVPHKGADVSWTGEQVCRDLKRLGHFGRVTLRE